MAVRLEAVRFEVADALAVAGFWAGLLGREVREESGGAWVPGDETQVGLRFVASSTEQAGRPWLHLHLTSTSSEHQRRTVETALRLGGRSLDVGQTPDETHVVLADPGGNEFCVIEPGNNFLAGAGFLGEVTCDGTWTVGLFWRDALGWPVVWDRGEQIAVQSPLGGTKISWDLWGAGPPVERRSGRNRQRFDLVAADPLAEAERLVSLGATRLSDVSGRVELADPDGNEFTLSRDESQLVELLRIIASGDTDSVLRMLAAYPFLATRRLESGATRQAAPAFYLDDIGHYTYRGDTPLHIAAAGHRPEVARALVAAGADTSAANRRGAQPLHYAADGAPGSTNWRPDDQAATIAFLIEAGADPNVLDLSGVAPLHRAVRTRCSAAVKALIEGGADPQRANKNGSTPMALATRTTGRGGSGSPEARAEQAEIVRILALHRATE